MHNICYRLCRIFLQLINIIFIYCYITSARSFNSSNSHFTSVCPLLCNLAVNIYVINTFRRNFKYNDVKLEFLVQFDDIAAIEPKYLILNETDDKEYDVTVYGKDAGHTVIYTNISEPTVR